HSDSDGCGGYKGLYSSGENTPRLDLCTSGRTPIAERLILHELGHAWVHHNLTDSQRQAFVTLQDLPAWTGATLDWGDRGSEQAAEILAWGLQETSRPPRSIPNNDPESLTTAFHQLTGTNPIYRHEQLMATRPTNPHQQRRPP
ncbi:MAG: hypothetical protein HKN80_02460, partial [Acidimicrobiia bacterium]|nr:hypothetical protein [Acidimicrobiia bacterium]